MSAPFDTIVAPITGPGPAAVTVVRLSGSEAWRIASEVFGPWPNPPEPRRALYGLFTHGDDGLALPFAAGHSFTGEESVELSCHGASASVRSLLENCLIAGARPAEPGEFTLRAFLNGRIDLTQAEGVRDTVEARTASALRAANVLRDGQLRAEVNALRDELVSIMAALEAAIDFSEEVGEVDRPQAADRLAVVAERISALTATAGLGRLLRQGLRIAIVGPPNAGKSSLLNALVGADRAIVSQSPGTTRDYLEETLEWGGIRVVLIDTAGLRESEDPVEAIGMQRTRTVAGAADIIWYVFDASLGWTEVDEANLAGFPVPAQVVANKSDLGRANRGIGVSALSREGLRDLCESILPSFEGLGERPLLIHPRHEVPLAASLAALAEAQNVLNSSRPTDLASVSLQEAIRSLGEVTGETATPDMLDRIFRDFCIGK